MKTNYIRPIGNVCWALKRVCVRKGQSVSGRRKFSLFIYKIREIGLLKRLNYEVDILEET